MKWLFTSLQPTLASPLLRVSLFLNWKDKTRPIFFAQHNTFFFALQTYKPPFIYFDENSNLQINGVGIKLKVVGEGVDLSKILTSNPQRSNAYVYILFISVPDTGKGQFAISGLILSYVHVFLYLAWEKQDSLNPCKIRVKSPEKELRESEYCSSNIKRIFKIKSYITTLCCK